MHKRLPTEIIVVTKKLHNIPRVFFAIFNFVAPDYSGATCFQIIDLDQQRKVLDRQ